MPARRNAIGCYLQKYAMPSSPQRNGRGISEGESAKVMVFGCDGPLVDPEFVSAIDSQDRKSTRLNSSHVAISYAVFCLKKKKIQADRALRRRAIMDRGTHGRNRRR